MRRFQQAGRAVGSEVLLTLVLEDSADADSLFKQLWQQIDNFEKQFSRFLEDSELSKFNQSTGDMVPVSDSFEKLLRVSKQLSQQTGGLFNPFILPNLQKAGYVGSWPNPADYTAALDYTKRTGIATAEQLVVRKGYAQIPKDTALEFGGIGKGYLLDELADVLATKGVQDYWLSLGGDIICNGTDVDAAAWSIAVQSAEDESLIVGTIKNNSGRFAVATSGTTKRRGAKAGKQWHHIIDPRTGQPTDTDIITATVCTEKAVLADVLAKCIVILGSKHTADFIKQHKVPTVLTQTKTLDGLEISRYGENIE